MQITKRFLECKVYAPVNWPSEFVDEYLPLLKAFHYNKGSLIQAGITSSSAGIVEVTSLPPIQECAFSSTDIDELETLINDGSTNANKVLILHQRCKAVRLRLQNQIEICVLGAKKSKHSRSSLTKERHTRITIINLYEL